MRYDGPVGGQCSLASDQHHRAAVDRTNSKGRMNVPQLLIHRAYELDLKILPETSHWIFDQCAFFVPGGELDDCDLDDPDELAEIADRSYSQGSASHLYVTHVNSWIFTPVLEADDISRKEIRAIWGEVDTEEMLTGGIEEDEDANGNSVEEGGWHIQRIRAQQARRMGFEAVIDRDETGAVWIVDFSGRNEELNARWKYLGEFDDLRS